MSNGKDDAPSLFMRRLSAVQLALACAAVFMLPIAQWGDGIGQWLLVGAAATGLPWCLMHWKPWMRSLPIMGLCACWLLAAFSILWSDKPSAAMLHALPSLVAIPAIMPIAHRPRVWIIAIAAGVAVQTIIQILAWKGVINAPIPAGRFTGGLYGYPPYVALWASTAAILAMGMITACRSKITICLLVSLACAAIIGLALTGARTNWAACGIALFIMALRIWKCPEVSMSLRRGLIITTAAIFLLSGTLFLTMGGWVRIDQAWRDATQLVLNNESKPVAHRGDSGGGLRVLWWHAGWQLLKERPLTGHGAGSILTSLARKEAEMPSAWGAGASGFITWNPHSTWVATAIETGIPGLVFLGMAMIGGACAGWRRGRTQLGMIGLGPAWIAVLIFSVTHAVLLETYTAVLIATLTAVLVLPPRASVTMTHPGD